MARILFWFWRTVVAVLLIALLAVLTANARCINILARSTSLQLPPLAPNCSLTENVPVGDEDLRKELDDWTAGLVNRRYVVCDLPLFQPPLTDFAGNPTWIPTYVPGGYQYRRTTVRGLFARRTPENRRHVVSEVGLGPWRKYARQIVGQCQGKYSVWK